MPVPPCRCFARARDVRELAKRSMALAANTPSSPGSLFFAQARAAGSPSLTQFRSLSNVRAPSASTGVAAALTRFASPPACAPGPFWSLSFVNFMKDNDVGLALASIDERLA